LAILIGILFCAVGIQIIYISAFIIGFTKKRQLPEGTAMYHPVSVIVCAHDEEANLRELIPSLLLQDHPDFEVIVVNERSNDGTYDFLLEETKKDFRIRMVHVDRVPSHVNAKKFGLTLGIKAATREWLLFLDADCRPAGSSWIRTVSNHFQDQTKFVLGFSPYSKLPGFLNLFIRFESLVTAIQYFSFALLRNPYMGVGRNLAYRKSLFLEKKGFNQFLNVTGGDDDLFVNQHAKAENTQVEFTNEAHVYSFPKKTWTSFFHQKVRHLSVGKRYHLKHRILLGVFTGSWIVSWWLGITLLLIDITLWPVAVALFVRMIGMIVLIRVTTRQLKLGFEVWTVPYLDFIYSIYYISTGLAALLTKQIRWRK
jgi:cellulose synthase/poly-beta-1,6-N-acetylglucosamine synthase-like glycosyltransferase